MPLLSRARRLAQLRGAGGGAPTVALQATDLDVAENDFVTILGPSGCGKSTLLRIVAGLDQPTAGEVLLDGRRIEAPGADRGMVFQSYTLFPWLTVLDNICFGLRERGVPRAEQLEIADGFIAKVGLRGFEHHYPEAALGRHAAAHRDRARAGQRPAHAADGRALRRARPPDARADAGAAARHLGGREARRCCSSRTTSTRRSSWAPASS